VLGRRPGHYSVKMTVNLFLLAGGWTAFTLIGRSWWQMLADQSRARHGVGIWLARRQAWLFFPMLLLEGLNLHVAGIRAMTQQRTTLPRHWLPRRARGVAVGAASRHRAGQAPSIRGRSAVMVETHESNQHDQIPGRGCERGRDGHAPRGRLAQPGSRPRCRLGNRRLRLDHDLLHPRPLRVAYGIQPLTERRINGRGETVVIPAIAESQPNPPWSATCART
jgi:hypothetical protein